MSNYPKEFKLDVPKGHIMNQKYSSACVAFACCYAMSLMRYASTGEWLDFAPYYLYGLDECDSTGWQIKYAMQAMQKYGMMPLAKFPQVNYSKPKLREMISDLPEADIRAADKFRITSYKKLRTDNEIKEALVNGHPVVFSKYIYLSSFGLRSAENLPEEITRKTSYLHAMCIIGWAVLDGVECWVVVNSWGENNGDSGICYVPVADTVKDAYCFDIPLCGEGITLTLDSKEILVDGISQTMDTAPYIKDGRTFVPIRFVAEALGYTVKWDADKRQVKIYK